MLGILKIFFAILAIIFFTATLEKPSFAFGNKQFYFLNNDETNNSGELNIISKIDRAKQILEKQKVDYKICAYKKRVWVKKGKRAKKKIFTVKYLCKKEFLLAVSHKEKNEIEIVRFKQNQADNENFWIEIGKPNGVATSFSVKYPLEYMVLATKTIQQKNNIIKNTIYTPYSKELNSSAIQQEGLNYLDKILQNAAEKINNNNIPSHFTDGKLIITQEWIKIAKTVAINEHIDPLEYIKRIKDGNDGEQNPPVELIEKVLVILGANRETAYKYSVSPAPAEARNLFQHIFSTYKYVYNTCSRADLKLNFMEGMDDHENAARATFCLFNLDLYALKLLNVELPQNPYIIRKYIASSYNYGAARTAKLIKKYGENWTDFLPLETQIYLKKFNFVWNFLSSIENSKLPDNLTFIK